MNWREKLENNIAWFALCLLALGWGAGVATCRVFPQFAGVAASGGPARGVQEQTTAESTLVLPAAWIPANSGTSILDGRGIISVRDYMVRTNRNESEVSIEVSLPGARWEGNNSNWVIVGGGQCRYFTWQTNRYVLNVLSVESDRTQVSVSRVAPAK